MVPATVLRHPDILTEADRQTLRCISERAKEMADQKEPLRRGVVTSLLIDLSCLLGIQASAWERHRPPRVLVDRIGSVCTGHDAWRRFHVRADYLLVHPDGWRLGAPAALLKVARHLFGGNWISVEAVNHRARRHR